MEPGPWGSCFPFTTLFLKTSLLQLLIYLVMEVDDFLEFFYGIKTQSLFREGLASPSWHLTNYVPWILSTCFNYLIHHWSSCWHLFLEERRTTLVYIVAGSACKCWESGAAVAATSQEQCKQPAPRALHGKYGDVPISAHNSKKTRSEIALKIPYGNAFASQSCIHMRSWVYATHRPRAKLRHAPGVICHGPGRDFIHPPATTIFN
jgi:hypothetical protein